VACPTQFYDKRRRVGQRADPKKGLNLIEVDNHIKQITVYSKYKKLVKYYQII